MNSNHKKRRREYDAVDTELVEIYEDLANEAEDVRLLAAHRLLSKISDTSVLKGKVLPRLFRGLCSGRKAARIGFSVVLTDLLSQTFSVSRTADDLIIEAVLDILRTQTTSEGKVSGQVCQS